MEWTDEDREALLAFKKTVDSDDIKIKEQIKQVILNNRYIIHVLNNKELEESEAEPSDYFNVNIMPYYMIPDTQTKAKNFICYEVKYDELQRHHKSSYSNSNARYNDSMKVLNIVFHILCFHLDIIDEETSIARHDLLAALIQDQFNETNYIGGGKLILVEDVPSTTDNKYATRTLVFRQITDNNLVKTKNGNSKLANKEIHVLGEEGHRWIN